MERKEGGRKVERGAREKKGRGSRAHQHRRTKERPRGKSQGGSPTASTPSGRGRRARETARRERKERGKNASEGGDFPSMNGLLFFLEKMLTKTLNRVRGKLAKTRKTYFVVTY